MRETLRNLSRAFAVLAAVYLFVSLFQGPEQALFTV